MSWFTVSWAIFLGGILVATASGATGLNYRRNGVVNAGLAGVFYFGTYSSLILSSILQMNPYWSIPFCVVSGAILNTLFNWGIVQMLRRGYTRVRISVLTSLFALVGYFAGKGLFRLFLGIYGGWIPRIHFLDHDFVLFQTPGILIISVAVMVFSMALQFTLSPVVEDRRNNLSNRWEIVVHSLAGASACLAGALYRFGFPSTRSVIVLIVAGALLGGVDRVLNPFLGGFLVTFTQIWLTVKGQELVGVWVGDYSFVIPVLLLLVSLPFIPKGIVGRIRSILEYEY